MGANATAGVSWQKKKLSGTATIRFIGHFSNPKFRSLFRVKFPPQKAQMTFDCGSTSRRMVANASIAEQWPGGAEGHHRQIFSTDNKFTIF